MSFAQERVVASTCIPDLLAFASVVSRSPEHGVADALRRAPPCTLLATPPVVAISRENGN